MLCGVLSGGGKCCSPVMCACVCAASSSQVTSSAPIVSGGAVAAVRSADVTKDDPLKPLYSSSLKASEELPFSHTVKTLEEWRRLSERVPSKGMCHMPCSYMCALSSRCGPRCTGTGVVTSQCTVWIIRMHLAKHSTLSKLSIQDVS